MRFDDFTNRKTLIRWNRIRIRFKRKIQSQASNLLRFFCQCFAFAFWRSNRDAQSTKRARSWKDNFDIYSRTTTKTFLQRLCNEFENLREVRCAREFF
jgi:hypothetical protein